MDNFERRNKHLNSITDDLHKEMAGILKDFATNPELRLSPLQAEKLGRIIEISGQIVDCVYESGYLYIKELKS